MERLSYCVKRLSKRIQGGICLKELWKVFRHFFFSFALSLSFVDAQWKWRTMYKAQSKKSNNERKGRSVSNISTSFVFCFSALWFVIYHQWWGFSHVCVNLSNWDQALDMSIGLWFWVEALTVGPERWWTILCHSEVMGNCDGSWCYIANVQIARSSRA